MHPGDALCDAVIDAAASVGIPTVADTNHVDSVSQGGFGYQPQTTWKAAIQCGQGFLDPVRSRANLTVVTDTDVRRIEFAGRRAAAVHVQGKSGERRIDASRKFCFAPVPLSRPNYCSCPV